MGTKVKSFFDSYTPTFSKISSDVASENAISLTDRLFNSLFRRSMKARFELTVKTIVESGCTSVLDIGCGPGDYSIALRKQGVKDIAAIDFASNMVDVAKQKEMDFFGESSIDWRVGDFLSTEFDKSFDAAVIVGVMDYIEEPQEFVDAVLKHTSKVAIFSFPCSGGFLAWQRRIRYKFRCYLRLYSKNEAVSLFNTESYSVELKDLGRHYLGIARKN